MTGTRYRKTLGIAFGVLILVFLFAGSAAARPTGTELYKGREVAPNEVIVKFRGEQPQVISQAVTGENVDESEYVGSTHALRFHSRNKNVDTLIRDLLARSDVEYVEPNYVVHATLSPNDPYYSYLWGLQKISAPSAWGISTGSAANVVGVVDTGIDYTHPDLAANAWSSKDAFTVTIGGTPLGCPARTYGINTITHTCDPMDDAGHGTHVSGTIGAVGNNGVGVAGVNWNAGILGVKFLNSGGSGYISDAVEAIDVAIQLKEIYQNTKGDNGANVRVLSNSWGGGGYSQALFEEIQKAYANDILFVAAAGNAGSNIDVTPAYPASYDVANVVAVAATDSNDGLASWSNYGKSTVDLGAPGVNIYSTVPGGYQYMSGTSMATPHVSGVAALVLSMCPTMTTDQLKADILNTVDTPVPSLVGKTASGRLNAFKAIQACSAPPTPDFSLTASPSSLSTSKGVPASSLITVTPLNGFGDTVTLTVSGAPSGMSASLNPTSIPGSGTSTLTVDAGTAAAGTYTLAVTGTSGSLTHSTSVAVTVVVPDFSVSASPPSQTVNRGSSTTYPVIITRLLQFADPVTLSVTGLPRGASASFSPNPVTNAQSTLTVKTASNSPTGTFKLTITGTSGSLTHKTSVTLVVRRGGIFGFSSRAAGTEISEDGS